ncbi:hypothetical protein U1Q18_016468, partial [Sarracenia purpurea var. burkii]
RNLVDSELSRLTTCSLVGPAEDGRPFPSLGMPISLFRISLISSRSRRSRVDLTSLGSWSAPGLVARPPLPRDSASPLGAKFDLVNLLCSAEFLDSVGRPQPVIDAWVEGFDPSTSIPFLLFSWFVRVVSPKADPTFAETGSGCCRDAVWTAGVFLGFRGGLCSGLI